MLHNEFEIVLRDSLTGEIKQSAKAYNIILNQFWDVFLSSSTQTTINSIQFGSGTATPQATDTTLTTFMGSKSATRTSNDFTDWKSQGVLKLKATIRLEVAEFQNTSISEVGFANGNTSNQLRTKSTIKDTNGNPITINKGTLDILDIYGTFFIKVPQSSDFGIFSRALNPYGGGIMCFLGMSTYGGQNQALSLGLNYLTSAKFQPQSTDWSNSTASYPSSVPTSATLALNIAAKTYTVTFSDVITSSSNLGGLKGIISSQGYWKIPSENFTEPLIVKESIGTGNGVLTQFNTAFGYILNNSTFKVYVNDVEVTATPQYDIPVPSTNISELLNIVDWNNSCDSNPCIGVGQTGFASGGWTIVENPYYATRPITSISFTSSNSGYGTPCVDTASNLGGTWTNILNYRTTSITVPAGSQGARYFKIYGASAGPNVSAFYSTSFGAEKIMTLAVAPANGATVTCTYQPNVIAKDVNKILKDVVVKLTFNEYTP